MKVIFRNNLITNEYIYDKCCQRCAHTKLIYRTPWLNLVANYGVKNNTQHTATALVKEIVSTDSDICLQP